MGASVEVSLRHPLPTGGFETTGPSYSFVPLWERERLSIAVADDGIEFALVDVF